VNFEQFFARFKAATAALTGGQITTIAIAFIAVVSLTIGSAYWLNTPSYGVLFSDMDPESAASVVTKLKDAKVTYTLDAGGRTIRVPASRVDELRLQYAPEGLAGGGKIVGNEIWDQMTFGVTDFQEQVNLRRSLEGELARSIATLSEVAGARVHLALPKASLFAGRAEETKASVVLKLRNNRQLAPSAIASITGLVSAGVPSLRPESVVIIDNYGRPLTKPQDPAGEVQGVPLERQQQIERDLSNRVLALIEPIVGLGHARVNVSARLNAETAEQTEERYEPQGVIRSHNTQVQGGMPVPNTPGAGAPPSAAAGGVAGARGNLPPPEAATDPAEDVPEPAATTGPGALLAGGRTAETTNYEISKTTRHSVTPRGEVTRLSVAVLLDENRSQGAPEAAPAGSAPDVAAPRVWAPAEVQKIQDVVAAAVGLDTERGDQLTVQTIAFEETPVEPVIEPGAWQRYGPQVFEALRLVGIVALGAFALFGVIRPMVRSALNAGPQMAATKRLGSVQAVVAGGQPRTVQDLEAEIDASAPMPDALRVPAMTRRMAALTQKEPENAARLLRTWLTEDR
jgi:flagellar M-ring protein FliF